MSDELSTLKQNIQLNGATLTRRQSLMIIDCLIECEDQLDRLLPVLKEAREAMESEEREMKRGMLTLGMWTPLNGLREVLPLCKDIEV